MDVHMAGYNLTGLDDPTAQSVLGSEAYGLNSSGEIVGIAYIPGTRAVSWSPSPTVMPRAISRASHMASTIPATS
jgi:hypothetical protein